MDAVIAAQSVVQVAERFGLGTCFVGSTLWDPISVSNILELPNRVIPVVSLVMGYSAEEGSKKSDRLCQGLIHRETYKQMSDQDLDTFYSEKDNQGWNECLRDEALKEVLKDGEIKNFAQYLSSNLKYGSGFLDDVSRTLLKVLKEKGFEGFGYN